MNGLLVPAGVLQKVGVVVVDFGIMRQSLDTRTETKRKTKERTDSWHEAKVTLNYINMCLMSLCLYLTEKGK